MFASALITNQKVVGTSPSVGNNRVAVEDQPAWEFIWAPYDEQTYKAVLAEIQSGDIVLEIGAGDLRLARQLAAKSRRVEAIEIQADILALGREEPLPHNLIVHLGDALTIPFPDGITIAVLLMRHCTHYSDYVAKLRNAGCQKLITNTRWHFGIEVVQLSTPRIPFDRLELGWYACECGAAGFKPGPVEKINPEMDQVVIEVCNCPDCL